MEQINNTYIKIELSKIAETFIFNSSLNIETKNRLLVTFALYRYSAYFWETNNLYYLPLNYEEVDALGEYIALHDGLNMIQDGKDVYAFAASLSLMSTLW